MKFILLLFISLSLMSQENEVLKIFNQQVEAFNQRDINKLVANVSDDFKWFYLNSDTLFLEVSGKDNFRKSMDAYFKQIKGPINSEIKSYSIEGNRISFREEVSYKNKAGKTSKSTALAIYEVKANKISRVWYFMN